MVRRLVKDVKDELNNVFTRKKLGVAAIAAKCGLTPSLSHVILFLLRAKSKLHLL